MGKQYVDSIIFFFIEIQCRGHVVKTLVMWMVPRLTKIYNFHICSAARYQSHKVYFAKNSNPYVCVLGNLLKQVTILGQMPKL